MHYFQFNIGDYKSHTSHLTIIEDIAYRRLLDWYYLHEKPISLNPVQAARIIIMPDNSKEVEQVLNEFFTRTEIGWINKRADKEIAVYTGFIDAGKRGAAKRWGQGDYSPPNSPPNQGLIANNNQEPLNNKQEKSKDSARKSSLSKLTDLGVDEQIARDWLTIRKAKKMPLTDTALKQIKREAELAKLTIPSVIEICAQNNWAGFKSTWEVPIGTKTLQPFSMDNFMRQVNGK